MESRPLKPSQTSSLSPAFVENDVDSYFRIFEKIAKQNEWTENKRLSIIVPKLAGKAYNVYA